VEIMVNTPRMRELLTDPRRGHEILEAIETGREPYGMVSFDQSLKDLMDRGLVTYEEALAQATRPDDLALHRRGVQRGDQTVAGGEAATAPELDLDDDGLSVGRYRK